MVHVTSEAKPNYSGSPEGAWESFGIFREKGFAGSGIRARGGGEGKKVPGEDLRERPVFWNIMVLIGAISAGHSV